MKKHFYVSCINGDRHGLLLGPFATHREALGYVKGARRKAQQVDTWAWFYAFGTCHAPTTQPGILNQYLTELPFAPPPTRRERRRLARLSRQPAPEPVQMYGSCDLAAPHVIYTERNGPSSLGTVWRWLSHTGHVGIVRLSDDRMVWRREGI